MHKPDENFPLDPNICYLNHAAVSPWPSCTARAVSDFADENVKFGASHYPKWLKVEQSLRENLATLIQASSSKDIALAKSTSEALSMIAYGINWKAGDEIIISDQEFPSNRIVWESLTQFGVKVVIAELCSESPIQDIENCVSANTRLISISSVQYASGLVMDLAALSQICKNNKILLCVDAIQSLGAIPFNQSVIDADFIVADGHKWMMSAEGLALFYIKPEHQKTMKLTQYGWHMIKNRGNYDEISWQPADDATRFECGSPNMLGIHAMNASIGFILDIGIDEVYRQLKLRVIYLIDKLRSISNIEFLSNTDPKDTLSGIVSFKIPHKDLKSFQATIMNRGVICAYRGGGIRLSPHFYTPLSVLDKAVEMIQELSSSQTS